MVYFTMGRLSKYNLQFRVFLPWMDIRAEVGDMRCNSAWKKLIWSKVLEVSLWDVEEVVSVVCDVMDGVVGGFGALPGVGIMSSPLRQLHPISPSFAWLL